MRSLRCLAILALLAGCNTGGPGFRGVSPTELEAGGSRFLMRRAGDLAEVLRVSPEMMPRFQAVAGKGGPAVAAATGCEVAWVVGDQVRMIMGLSCAGRPAPPKPRPHKVFVCDAMVSGVRSDLLTATLDLDCVQT